MLLFDQESGQPTRRSAHGLSGTAGHAGRAFDALARDIEETQRQQAETMAHILERLRAIEAARPTSNQSAATSQSQHHFAAPGASSDEPWDPDTAEALTKSYEASPEAIARGSDPKSAAQQDWLGERFGDLTQHITRALADLKASSATTLLEERLDGFQKLISSALQDVVRRSDLDGMRLIELHVNELGDKLDELERHVSRIDGIEADVRNVIEQVSDARISKLLDYDARFAADLDAVARRAAEEVHSRFGQMDTQVQSDSRRHDELRALIEASIQDRREADAQAVSMVSGLTGRVSAQSDRYDELKGLLEQAIQEQRQNEQTAFGMLDTLQQALVTVLDRMDALEHQQHVPFAAPYSGEHENPVPAFAEPVANERTPQPLVPAAAGEAAYGFRDTRYDAFTPRAARQMPTVEVPAAFESAGPEIATNANAGYYVSSDESGSDETDAPVDRLRRDFVADARRAKMKATANRAEALAESKEQEGHDSISQVRAALTQDMRDPPTGTQPGGRLFGMSTKLLAGVLALIVAINGGLLILTHKGSLPFVSETSRPALPEQDGATDGAPQASDEAPDQPAGAFNAGPRSDLGGHGAAGLVPQPYGYHDDVLDPPEVETMGNTLPEVPSGMTIARPAGTMPDEAVADVYEQQVLASLSGKLGAIAAGQTPGALLPEHGGRIEAGYPQPEIIPAEEGATAKKNVLDLPPAAVGPQSLRMAAANGDASAEFEVAARLAEGKGVSIDYASAVRWYQRSAAKGFAQAQYRLGTLYERGLGVAKDLERAKVWYGRAADNGNVKSMHNLAVLISSGEHGEPNYSAASPWFTKAAEHGLADSQYNLGVLLENGLGGKADLVAAYKWYALAAKNGDQDASQRLVTVKAKLSAPELASAQQMIANFRARPASPLANDARAAGEDWKKRANGDTNT